MTGTLKTDLTVFAYFGSLLGLAAYLCGASPWTIPAFTAAFLGLGLVLHYTTRPLRGGRASRTTSQPRPVSKETRS